MEMRPVHIGPTARERELIKQQKEDRKFILTVPEEQWRQETEARIFGLFEMTPRWSIQELTKKLEVSIHRLKPVVGRLCVYIKGGPYKGLYELKDELKTEGQRVQKAQDEARAAAENPP